MRDAFRRGHSEDLPVRPSTSAHFDWLARSRNLFDLRLPETLLARKMGIIAMPIREEVSLTWEWRHDHLKSLLNLEEKVRIEARCTPEPDSVYLTLDVENLSNHNWSDVRAVVCMRLISAPDFADTARERTHWWAEGQWKQLDIGFPRIEREHHTPALIAVESDPEGYVFATGWKEVWQVGGNDMLHNVCVHTDPFLGQIQPKEKRRTDGVLLFLEGNREEALAKFLETI